MGKSKLFADQGEGIRVLQRDRPWERLVHNTCAGGSPLQQTNKQTISVKRENRLITSNKVSTLQRVYYKRNEKKRLLTSARVETKSTKGRGEFSKDVVVLRSTTYSRIEIRGWFEWFLIFFLVSFLFTVY